MMNLPERVSRPRVGVEDHSPTRYYEDMIFYVVQPKSGGPTEVWSRREGRQPYTLLERTGY
jgi:hypothetical protein